MLRHNTVLAIMACSLVPLAMMVRPPVHDLIVEQIDGMASSSGLSHVTHDLYRDWLNQGTQQLVSFDLDADRSYVMIGACDADCSELHFSLLAPDGASAGQVEATGNRPIMTVHANRRGKYQLRASMRQCRLQPCEWGVRVYRR
jgi:hypothetical protein